MSKKKREQKQRARNKKLFQTVKGSKERFSDFESFQSQSLENLQPPEGFRAITITQALLNFAKPLQEFFKEEDTEGMNVVIGLANDIWNYTLVKVPLAQKKTPEEIVEQICEQFEIDETEAFALFDEMVERKAYLFPDDIQPADVRNMFMRKEEEYRFAAFDEEQLQLLAEAIPSSPEDLEMLHTLRDLDRTLREGIEYGDWEELYFQAEERCCTRFYAWLNAKDTPKKQANEFPYCIEIFLDFVYRFHAAPLTSIDSADVYDFLHDHLLRKVSIRPDEYVYWPPAIRLFYSFLSEQGYIEDPTPFIRLFKDAEPEFIALLKKLY